MTRALFRVPMGLKKHSSLIYAEGIFGLDARRSQPMRPKTADGILRYAKYKISGIIDSKSREKTAGEALGTYLAGNKNYSIPIFRNIKSAKNSTGADVLVVGAAPEGGALPKGYAEDIEWAIRNKMHIVSGMHYALGDDSKFNNLAAKNKIIIWDTRNVPALDKISIGSARAYHIKKPIVLTVGTDAALGKMTATYEMNAAAEKLGLKSCVIPTGQTAIMIDGWGIAIDALPADFMAGAVEDMIYAKEKKFDIFFVEGQGSLFHPAYANTCISLIHGAVPTHLVLVHRPLRKHSVGSRLVKLPNISQAIEHYEKSVIPPYRNAKVVAVALNAFGMKSQDVKREKSRIHKETGLPVGDIIQDKTFATELITELIL